ETGPFVEVGEREAGAWVRGAAEPGRLCECLRGGGELRTPPQAPAEVVPPRVLRPVPIQQRPVRRRGGTPVVAARVASGRAHLACHAPAGHAPVAVSGRSHGGGDAAAAGVPRLIQPFQ